MDHASTGRDYPPRLWGLVQVTKLYLMPIWLRNASFETLHLLAGAEVLSLPHTGSLSALDRSKAPVQPPIATTCI